jgi:DNA mismatch endonuclease, patch repair protein
MSLIRGHGNKGTELRLIQAFQANGITGWRRGCIIRGPAYAPTELRRGKQTTEDRRQKKRFSVRPDFVFPKLRVALFVDGCFWHGCPKHATWPKTRAAFWRSKIEGNRARDRRVNSALRKRGWTVLRIWEHELRRKDEARLLRRLAIVVGTKPGRA